MLLPWLRKHLRDVVLITTTVLATAVTARQVVTEKEASDVIAGETPLERATRRLIGVGLITCGNTLKTSPFVNRLFADQVGGQLQLIGYLLEDFELISTRKKEQE